MQNVNAVLPVHLTLTASKWQASSVTFIRSGMAVDPQLCICWIGLRQKLLQDLAINLIFAGYDTCASSVHFLLRELYFNPHCLQALRKEQRQVSVASIAHLSSARQSAFSGQFHPGRETFLAVVCRHVAVW